MFEIPDDSPSKQNAKMSVGSGPIITGVHTALIDVPLRQRTITDSQSSVESVEFLPVSYTHLRAHET